MRLLNSRINYDGKFLDFHTDTFLTETGTEIQWESVSRKNNTKAVMIVPYHIKRKEFVLISEYRCPIKGREIGFCAGLLDKSNENLNSVIKRELKEETGLDLIDILKVSPFVYSSAGMTDESIAIAYVTVNGEPNNKFNQDNEDIIPFFADKNELSKLLTLDSINWGAKAWVICDNIVNPIKFEGQL